MFLADFPGDQHINISIQERACGCGQSPPIPSNPNVLSTTISMETREADKATVDAFFWGMVAVAVC